VISGGDEEFSGADRYVQTNIRRTARAWQRAVRMSSKLSPISWKRLRCVFEHDGFVFKPGKGDPWKGEKAGVARPIVIPVYDEVGLDIVRSCMRTAGMTRERYLKLLEKC